VGLARNGLVAFAKLTRDDRCDTKQKKYEAMPLPSMPQMSNSAYHYSYSLLHIHTEKSYTIYMSYSPFKTINLSKLNIPFSQHRLESFGFHIPESAKVSRLTTPET
jgi:hypothetical protein